MEELQKNDGVGDFESDIDNTINRFFETKRVTIDQAEMSEKRFIIKELALASKKTEIVKKLNEWRVEKGLPELSKTFDLYYYQKEYGQLIESLSLAYAQNIIKKYRFAGRIPRVAKLNEIAEGVLDRIKNREEAASTSSLPLLEEKVHNENIKIFSTLLGAIDEQMGKLKVTTIDVNLRTQSEKPVIANAADLQEMIRKTILEKYSNQLPNVVDANFTELTDYHKCAFAEEWSGGKTFCKYFHGMCKVQTEEVKNCGKFLNRLVIENKEHMTKLYRDNALSARQIAEIAGAKEVDEKSIEAVRDKLREFGIWMEKR